jgi:hypothetical protein
MIRIRGYSHLIDVFVAVGLLFAMTEIQIEGPAGWASNLPTWRIEKHPLLDILWEGKPFPVDYYVFGCLGALLIVFSFCHSARGRR